MSWVRRLSLYNARSFSFLAIVVAMSLFAPLSSAHGLDLPAVGVWNGYNGQYNVIECSNGSNSSSYQVRVVVRDNGGNTLGTVPFTLPPRGTKHIVLNDFPITDAYGTFVIEHQNQDEQPYVPFHCHTAFYRLNQTGSAKALQYAFSIPVGRRLHGWTSGIYNSMNPAQLNTPVYNWLTVYNLSDEPFSAQVRVYDQDGKYSKERSFEISQLPPGQRHDFPLGHEEGQVVGLYRIVPEQWMPYGAFVTRYSEASPGQFNFAFPLHAAGGRVDSGPVPASTMDPAVNWAEIANLNNDGIAVEIELRNSAGALVHTEERFIPPFSQTHLYVNQFLGPRAVGTVRARSLDGDSEILVQSLFYGRLNDQAPNVEWAYASQATGGTSIESHERITVPVNTFLGASNWTKYLSSNAVSSTVEMSFHDALGTTMNRDRRTLPSAGTLDIGAHEFSGYDRAGVSVARFSENTQLSGEHIRVYPHSGGGIGYIMNIAPEVIYDWSGSSQWSLPLGVPDPGFGLDQDAPARPAPWDGDVSGFYYVQNDAPGCRAEGNGNPASPRCRIPNDLPAGSVVEVHGAYHVTHLSPDTITAHGTLAEPVFIRGQTSEQRPYITGPLHLVWSSNVILENLQFGDRDGDRSGGETGQFIVTDSDHVTLRHSDLHGNAAGGGVTIIGSSGSAASDVLIYDNRIHDNGDRWTATSSDVHGIFIGPRVSGVWVLDNFIYRNSGDGMRVDAGEADRMTTHDIFAGRNVAYENRLAAMWANQSSDLVFTQNTVFDQYAGPGSVGAGMGFANGPERIWFLFNHIYNANYGLFGGNGAGTDGDGYYAFYIGNLIHDIRADGQFNPEDVFGSGQAIHNRAAESTFFVNNTIYNVDGGISCLSEWRCYFTNNIIARLAPAGKHILIPWHTLAAESIATNNLLYQPGAAARIDWGGVTYEGLTAFVSATGKGEESIEADPRFELPEALNFHLQESSPAVNAGFNEGIYSAYEERYDVGIRRDREGRWRPQGGAFDLGAHERW